MDAEPITQGPGDLVNAEIGALTPDVTPTLAQIQSFSLYDPNIAIVGLAAGIREANRTH